MLNTTTVKVIAPYSLALTFNNHTSGTLDLSKELWGDMFAPLKDQQLFSTAKQSHTMGTACWANGADLAPEFLYQLMTQQRTQQRTEQQAAHNTDQQTPQVP